MEIEKEEKDKTPTTPKKQQKKTTLKKKEQEQEPASKKKKKKEQEKKIVPAEKNPNIMYKKYAALRYYLQNYQFKHQYSAKAYIYQHSGELFRKYVDIRKLPENGTEPEPQDYLDTIIVMQNPGYHELKDGVTFKQEGLYDLVPDITLRALMIQKEDEQILKKRQMNWTRILNLSDYEHPNMQKFLQKFDCYVDNRIDSHCVFFRKKDIKELFKLGENTQIILAWGNVAQLEQHRKRVYNKITKWCKKLNNQIYGWKSVYDEKQMKLCWRYAYQRTLKDYQDRVEYQKKQKEEQEQKKEKQKQDSTSASDQKSKEDKDNSSSSSDDDNYNEQWKQSIIKMKKFDPSQFQQIYGYYHPLSTMDCHRAPYDSWNLHISQQIIPDYEDRNTNPIECADTVVKELREKKQKLQQEKEERKQKREEKLRAEGKLPDEKEEEEQIKQENQKGEDQENGENQVKEKRKLQRKKIMVFELNRPKRKKQTDKKDNENNITSSSNSIGENKPKKTKKITKKIDEKNQKKLDAYIHQQDPEKQNEKLQKQPPIQENQNNQNKKPSAKKQGKQNNKKKQNGQTEGQQQIEKQELQQQEEKQEEKQKFAAQKRKRTPTATKQSDILQYLPKRETRNKNKAVNYSE